MKSVFGLSYFYEVSVLVLFLGPCVYPQHKMVSVVLFDLIFPESIELKISGILRIRDFRSGYQILTLRYQVFIEKSFFSKFWIPGKQSNFEPWSIQAELTINNTFLRHELLILSYQPLLLQNKLRIIKLLKLLVDM